MSLIAARVARTKIGKYQVLEKIGKGGMGAVYKAQDPSSGAIVAIKVISEDVTVNPVLGLRFAQECQITGKLDHPNIVRVLDFGIDGTRPYLVMEYVDGGSLGDRLEREGRLSEKEAVRIIAQVGQALHWAHKHQLVHRDVKPDNILLTSDGEAKLIDLGLAKNLDSDFNLTQTMSCLGTPNFMSPEQLMDSKRADALADLYSLAATLYMAITGELPFRGRNARALATIFQKKKANDIAPPRKVVPEVSKRVDDAIMRALHPDRAKRHASMLEFVESLTDGAEPLTSHAPAPMPALAPNEPTPSIGRDQRVHRRYSSARAISCRTTQRLLDDPWNGRVLNISATGLCLEIKRRFERGALLTIALDGEQFIRRSLIVRVMWVKQLSPEKWKMGCRLDQPLCGFEIPEQGSTIDSTDMPSSQVP